MTREEIDSFVWDDPELGPLRGWQALRRRAWLLAMESDPKDAIRYMQWLDARAHGLPKQQVSVEEQAAATVDYSAIPIERRRVLLAALAELEQYAGEPADEPVEH